MIGVRPRAVRILIGAGLAMQLIAGGWAWSVALLERGYNYDELLRTHSLWMTSQGMVPYDDFFECHPPYFQLLSWLIAIRGESPETLTLLRVFASIGSLLFLASLWTTIRGFSPDHGPIIAIGLLAIAFDPYVLAFLLEFRVDAWAYAALGWSVWGLERKKMGVGTFGATTTFASLLLCPKLLLLAPLIILGRAFAAPARSAEWASLTARYGAGVILSVLAFLGLIWSLGINLHHWFELAFAYHRDFNSQTEFGFGLATELPRHMVPLTLVVGGTVVRLGVLLGRRERPSALEIGVALFLMIQPIVVGYPWMQYVAPWYLWGSVFAGLGLATVERRFPWIAAALALALVGHSTYLGQSQARSYGRMRLASGQRLMFDMLLRVTKPGDYVYCFPHCHPLFRRDVSYGWFDTHDRTGYATERLMKNRGDLAIRFTPSAYAAELARHPPSLVALGPEGEVKYFLPGQNNVVKQYVNQAPFELARVGDFLVLVRPDRLKNLEP